MERVVISYSESLEILNSIELEPTKVVELPLMQAQDMFLAEDIVASFNSPEFATSAMDGYAIKAEDQALGELKVIAINPAGADEVPTLIGGKAIKTFTGSLMPKDSDTLIPIENVEYENGKITIKEDVPFGFSVREAGENFKKGELLIKKGTKIDFEQIAVLASLNYVTVKVYSKVDVAVIATGSELLELGQEQTKESQIRSSNNYTIEAIAKKYGANAINYGCINDDVESIKRVFKEALSKSDIVVSTGGVSVGDFDFVKDVVRDELGASVLFKGVVIKPGQHIMVAKAGNKVIIALPGFAYSSTVTALVYLLPIIYKYYNSEYSMPIVEAKLKSKYTKKSKKTEFTPANLTIKEGELSVDFIGKKDGTSAIMTNMLGNTALTITSSDDSSKDAGEKIQTYIYNFNFLQGGKL
jgi:molybdopterin molybdotransferase